METRVLRNFIAVAEERSIRRAAVFLHITQPALTRQIHSLEDELGVALFVRTVNGMEITPAGKSLLQHAENIVAEIELAKRNVRQAVGEQDRKIDVGVFGSATLNVIPEILMRFSRLNPNVEVVLHNAREDQQIQSLRHGKILVAFDRNFQEDSEIACELVLREPAMVALPQNHPLADRDFIDAERLRDEPCVSGFRKAGDDEEDSPLGFKPKIVQKVDDLLSAMALVGKGVGICFGPSSLQSSSFPGVVLRPFSKQGGFFFELRCVYLRKEQSPLLRALLDVVREYQAENCNAQRC